MRALLEREFVRFLVAGGIGTAATYLLYLALLEAMPYQGAYTSSYVAGILLSFALNTFFVFRQPWSWAGLAKFPLVYVVQYAFGLGCLALLVEVLGVDARLAPLAVIALSIPLTFVLSRTIIRGRTR